MAGPPASLRSQAPDRDRGEANVVTRVSQWADNHLRLVQHVSTGMAIAGIMLLLRSVRLTSKFTASSDIPVEFIRKKVKLRGRLQQITERGLEIEHIPITLPFISSWKNTIVLLTVASSPEAQRTDFKKPKSEEKYITVISIKEPCGLLLVKLAGVELTEPGKAWLQKELKPSQLLWFQLLGKEDSALFCYLFVNKGGYFNVNLNEEILRRGLGKTVLVKGLNYDSKTHWKIHRNLLKAELSALKKGEGIWKEESEKESYFRKLKDSWRERWTRDNELKAAGADLSPARDSPHASLLRAYGIWKDRVSNCSLVLKLRECVSRLHFRRKG